MARIKRGYILASCILSGAAAIISFVSLGTQEWVWADAVVSEQNPEESNYIRLGLFGGYFHQESAATNNYDLTMACDFGLNACALLCGDNMVENIAKLHNEENPNNPCQANNNVKNKILPRAIRRDERKFINAGAWICTILFLIISALIGLASCGLAVYNTATSPYQVYLSVLGLSIYNGVAFFTLLIAVALWGGIFSQVLIDNIPTYQTFVDLFSTEGGATLGYSYWINLVSLFFYICSICLLYIRNYVISKEPKHKVELEETNDPVIYLY